MDIVDGQLHANQIGPHWQTADLETTLDATVVAMDAVGVHAAVLDEFTGLDDNHHMLPGSYHANGAWRPERPFSELAAATYPGPVRVADPRRPPRPRPQGTRRRRSREAGLCGHPRARGLRRRSVAGPLLPPRRLRRLVRRLRGPPGARVHHDHSTAGHPGAVPEAVPGTAVHRRPHRHQLAGRRRLPDRAVRPPRSGPRAVAVRQRLPEVVACRAARRRPVPVPGPDATLPQGRRCLRCRAGPWASDHTQAVKAGLSPHPAPYSHSLHYLCDTDVFSAAEKEWLLGRTVLPS